MTALLRRLEALLIVGIGGFAGSSSRHLVNSVIPGELIGTAVVNVLGCLVLGFVLYEELYEDTLAQPTRTILATGFIASFTTYSAFIFDTVTAQPVIALVYVGGSYVLGFLGILIGRAGARRITSGGLPAEVTSGD